MFLNIMERRYDYDPIVLQDLVEPIQNLFGDEEAIKILLIERLSDE